MQFWQSGLALAVMTCCVLALVAAIVIRAIPPLRSIGIPHSIFAGLLALAVGPSGLALVKLDQDLLEAMVYHGLAITFIAVSLQPAERGTNAGGDAFSYGMLVTFNSVTQGAVGMGVILAIGLFGGTLLHPGFGLMLPLGFNQGPGQALSMGKAWEASGMTSGAQYGLIVAALGFAWNIVIGIPLVAYGKARGWIRPAPARQIDLARLSEPEPDEEHPGAFEPLVGQILAVGTIYLVAWWVVQALAGALSARPQLSAMVWGFHFMVAAIIAIGVRAVLARLPRVRLTQKPILGRIAALAVDVTTFSAIAAIQIEVFKELLVPILLTTTLGGVITLLTVLWLGSRSFDGEAFEHSALLFGVCTGTLPTGLALLRVIDPKLQGRAAASTVLGSLIAMIFGVPLLLGVLPYPVSQWPDGHPAASWITVGILFVYTAVVLAIWRIVGGLRFRRPWSRIWLERPPSP